MNTHRVPNFTSPLVYFSKSRPTQAFGLGRELVGGVGGDALRVSRKRDDSLRASWHILVPSAEVVREASRQRTGYGM